jgi:hypothetical protein
MGRKSYSQRLWASKFMVTKNKLRKIQQNSTKKNPQKKNPTSVMGKKFSKESHLATAKAFVKPQPKITSILSIITLDIFILGTT